MTTSSNKTLQLLAQRLSKVDINDYNAKKEILTSLVRGKLVTPESPDESAGSQPLIQPFPDGGVVNRDNDNHTIEGGTEAFFDLLQKYGLQTHDLVLASASTSEKPLEYVPCANVETTKNLKCEKRGKMACSNCKLVSYCSRDCQRTHWGVHKLDCKDPIRSPSWQKDWIEELQQPVLKSSRVDQYSSVGMHVWGSIPAVDTLNLSMNEGSSEAKMDIALAYVASGDLRDIMRTINELPSNYSGELTVVLNDREPMIVLRNILLLMILGTIKDHVIAAECALHFWVSAYLQNIQDDLVADMIFRLGTETQGYEEQTFYLNLGELSTITGLLSEKTLEMITRTTDMQLTSAEAHAEVHRVRFEPTRQEQHYHNYLRLNPSHRLASLEYRRLGVVLPFGAANNTFTVPNRFLFSPEGRWLPHDLASPLHSWKIQDVISAGKVHGAQPEDLYGCLYFYLSDQLRSFSQRIRDFKISFHIFDEDARKLAENIHSGLYEDQGLSKDIVFDRIDVSNIIDVEYVGIQHVLADWTPFLSRTNRYATILGHSMSWVSRQNNSEPHSNSRHLTVITQKLLDMGKLDATINPDNIPAFKKYYTALYDNSGPFEEYLKEQGADEAAQQAGCKRKKKHSIVPHRIGTSINGPRGALPDFFTEESWYWNVQVADTLLSERFVEFARD